MYKSLKIAIVLFTILCCNEDVNEYSEFDNNLSLSNSKMVNASIETCILNPVKYNHSKPSLYS